MSSKWALMGIKIGNEGAENKARHVQICKLSHCWAVFGKQAANLGLLCLHPTGIKWVGQKNCAKMVAPFASLGECDNLL